MTYVNSSPFPPRYLHYENAYLAGDLDPAFEVTTAFEMRHALNGDACDGDLAWMRETMANYGPQYIAMNYSVGRDWRYAESVHRDVAYVHTHCPQPNYTTVCSGHYSEIPAKGGICGFRGKVAALLSNSNPGMLLHNTPQLAPSTARCSVPHAPDVFGLSRTCAESTLSQPRSCPLALRCPTRA